MAENSSTTWAKIARRIRVPVGFAFAAVYVWLAHPTWRSIFLGLTLVVVGILIRALASGQLSKNEHLATGGLYAYTRNPLYLGSLILGLGFAIAARNWWIAAILGGVFAAIYLPVIHSEEEFLRSKFPEFEEYAREVPRFIPHLQSGIFDGNFSWDLYLKHREYNAAVGAMVLTAALVAKMLWCLRPI